MQIAIDEILIKDGRRELDKSHVHELAESIRELGLLNPITIDQENVLIAGLHRIEAVKALGWTEITCTISSLEGLQAELAEIDENIVRSDLSVLDYGEMLLRRKEIYEQIHPETRHGGDRKSEEIKAKKIRLDPAKSFVQDTAQKLKVVPRTVELQVQTAKNLTPETKEIIRDSNTKITKKTALKLSRMDAEQQKEAATLLAAGKIRSVDEYKTAKSDETKSQKDTDKINTIYTDTVQTDNAHTLDCTHSETEKEPSLPESEGTTPSSLPYKLEGKQFPTLKESIADLNDPDKDCRCTPDSFLAEFDAFVRKFQKEMEWYNTPYYEAVYPLLTQPQRIYLEQQMEFIHQLIDQFHSQIEEKKAEERKPVP